MAHQNPTGYSATVRIWLYYGEKMIPLSHASSTFVIAKAPEDLPAGDAEIVFTVDGERYERRVQLVDGMSVKRREAMVLSCDAISPF